jgi:hypothetical protein
MANFGIFLNATNSQVAVKRSGYSWGGGCADFGGNHFVGQSVC